jgi:hypothetical protein
MVEIRESKTPRTDREVYRVKECDIGFEVVNPALCREFEEKLAESIKVTAARCGEICKSKRLAAFCVDAIKKEFDLE